MTKVAPTGAGSMEVAEGRGGLSSHAGVVAPHLASKNAAERIASWRDGVSQTR